MANLKDLIVNGITRILGDLYCKNLTASTLSIGRKAGTIVGAGSVATGYKTTASGDYSHAEGSNTTAGDYSHAEGAGATAFGDYCHAEGWCTTAFGDYSHAEGESSSNVFSYIPDLSAMTSNNDIIDEWNTRKFSLAIGDCSHVEGCNCLALGAYSHAEGWHTIAKYTTHAEGNSTTASGDASHAEGNSTTASGDASHTEGQLTTASGSYSHAEGKSGRMSSVVTADTALADIITAWNTTKFSLAKGEDSHVEGSDCLALDSHAHAEGSNNIASGESAHAEGCETTASGTRSHTEGSATTASGNYSHAEGYNTTAIGDNSHSEGCATEASGGSHVEGYASKAVGGTSHAEGQNTVALGNFAHSEGFGSNNAMSSITADTALVDIITAWNTKKFSLAKGTVTHVEGRDNLALSAYSHAEGYYTITSDLCSHAEGNGTTASNYASHAGGHYNAAMTTGGNYNNTTGTAFVIGNGTSTTALSNAFSVQYSGVVKAKSTITASTTADYAEFFEWKDKNPDNEDRVGYFVTLDGDKIKIASNTDKYILGIVSGEPFVLGNGDCDTWNGMYLHDEFRRTIYEPAPKVIIDDDGEYKEVPGEYEGTRPKLNPNYDRTKPYVSRFDRKEWSPVGMLGVLAVRHDGTAKVNGYVTVNKDGIATACDIDDRNSYRVIKSNSDSVVEIIFK